jgi:hypothetical protein
LEGITMTAAFTIGSLVLNTLTAGDDVFTICGRVVEIMDNGLLVLHGHGLNVSGCRWAADPEKCRPLTASKDNFNDDVTLAKPTEAGASFTAVYQMGGANGDWRRCLPVDSREAAQTQVDEIVRGGRPAYVHDTFALNVIGMPEGPSPYWDYEALAWKPPQKKRGRPRRAY